MPGCINFRLNVCRPCLSFWIVSIWHYKTICVGFSFFLIFFEFFMLISMRPSLRLGDMSQDPLIFVWMYVDLVYQLESLVYDIIRLCALVLNFFWNFYAHLNATEFEMPRCINFCLNVCRPCLSTWIVNIWHYKTMCVGFLFFLFFYFLCSFECDRVWDWAIWVKMH